MRTQKFEARVTNLVATRPGVWLDNLPQCMPIMQKIYMKLDVEFGGIHYEAFGKYELVLMDTIHFISIGQRHGALKFYFDSIDADESSDECFDDYYDRAMLWRELNRRQL